MLTYLLRRLAQVVPTVLGVTILVFALIHLVPGDPAALMLGEAADPRDVAELRHQLHLDLPLQVQLVDYLERVAVLDLGRSFAYDADVAALIAARVPSTAALASAALALALLVALPLGVLAALHRGRAVDHASMTIALLGVSMPTFWIGPLLLWLLAVRLDLFPTGGAEGVRSLVLPAVTLALPLAALLSRMTRASLLEEMSQDYVRVASAKGLSRDRAVVRHALRNALIPVITVVGLQFGGLLTGAIITEQVFAWPGLGGLLLDAIGARDYPLVQGTILLFALLYVGVNLATDLAYAAVDPRVRLDA